MAPIRRGPAGAAATAKGETVHLLVISGPDEGRRFPLPRAGSIVIGISHRNADICLRDLLVSRVHCQVEFEHGQAVVSELNAHGTFVNDERATRRPLQPGDVIRIGRTQLLYQDGGDEPEDPAGMGGMEEVESLRAPYGASLALVAPRRVSAVKDGSAVLVADETSVAQRAPLPMPRTLPSPELTDLCGSRMSNYAIGELLGRGRFGPVYRARDCRDDSSVALRVIAAPLTRGSREQQRFLRAVREVLGLWHPNLVGVCAAGRSVSRNCYWIAMDHVEGRSLAQQLRGQAADWKQAVRVGVHIARALQHAREHDLAHRNLTPRNILIRDSDHVALLADLVMARALKRTLESHLKIKDALLSDLPYWAPERTEGEKGDGCADLYSLGVVLYQMLTGRPPFLAAGIRELVEQIRRDAPIRPSRFCPAVSPRFEAIVLRLLAKRPEDRYETSGTLVATLNRLAWEHGVAV